MANTEANVESRCENWTKQDWRKQQVDKIAIKQHYDNQDQVDDQDDGHDSELEVNDKAYADSVLNKSIKEALIQPKDLVSTKHQLHSCHDDVKENLVAERSNFESDDDIELDTHDLFGLRSV